MSPQRQPNIAEFVARLKSWFPAKMSRLHVQNVTSVVINSGKGWLVVYLHVWIHSFSVKNKIHQLARRLISKNGMQQQHWYFLPAKPAQNLLLYGEFQTNMASKLHKGKPHGKILCIGKSVAETNLGLNYPWYQATTLSTGSYVHQAQFEVIAHTVIIIVYYAFTRPMQKLSLYIICLCLYKVIVVYYACTRWLLYIL